MVTLRLWVQNFILIERGPLAFVAFLSPCYLLPTFVFHYLDDELLATMTDFLCRCVSYHISREGCDVSCVSITVINIEMTGTRGSRDSTLIWKCTVKFCMYIWIYCKINLRVRVKVFDLFDDNTSANLSMSTFYISIFFTCRNVHCSRGVLFIFFFFKRCVTYALSPLLAKVLFP